MVDVGQTRVWRALGVVMFLVILSFSLANCLSTETARVTPTPTKTPRPTFTPVPVQPTSTHVPTATPTLMPEPTEEPTATVTSVPTSTPEPTETPEPSATPWPTLDPNACPLTGLTVSDPALLERRPLAIKVQNAPLSRPQFGLPQADIVYEHLSEAGITRFTGIFLCQDVAKIGSVRSARFIDLEIPAMYKSLMALSGTSPGLLPKLENSDFSNRLFWYDRGINSAGFYRDKELRQQGLAIEHTLFGDPAKIWEIAEKKDINQPQDLEGLTLTMSHRREGRQPIPFISPIPTGTWLWTIAMMPNPVPICAARVESPSSMRRPASRSLLRTLWSSMPTMWMPTFTRTFPEPIIHRCRSRFGAPVRQ